MDLLSLLAGVVGLGFGVVRLLPLLEVAQFVEQENPPPLPHSEINLK